MLSEVKIYRPTKELCWKDGMRLKETISREEVAVRFDATLTRSRSHKGVSADEYKAQHPDAKKLFCGMCGAKFYAVNPRNTKFCSPKCGRNMSNIYKQKRKHGV